MKEHVVLKVVADIMIPFIILFGLYVLAHGETTPGGGFQGGVICAAAVILHAIVHGRKETARLLPAGVLRGLAFSGVAVFLVVGLAGMFAGSNFLSYDWLGQQNGIMVVEAAICVSVFAVVSGIYMEME